jgi:peroxiredoxin
MTIPSAIAVNAPIGQGVLYHIDDSRRHISVPVAELFKNGVTVVFGGPAPFSRLDTEQAEQYELAAEQLLSLGIDRVVAIYCQDAFVCQKFRETISEKTQTDYLRYYGDGDGFFVRAYDLWRDFTYQGLSLRSERWCAVVKDNIVQFVAHDDYQEIDNTHVDKVIEWLKTSN